MIPAGSHVAVVGAGAAGLAAAFALRSRHRVTLFEASGRAGGHAHTYMLDGQVPLDLGFMVLNDRNYPCMHALLRALGGIAVGPSEMSFGFQGPGMPAYALNFGPDAATPAMGPEPALFTAIARFLRRAARDLAAGLPEDLTLADYMALVEAPEIVRARYVLPMASAIWSAAPAEVLDAPAAFILGFYRHHGLLVERDPPRWQHVVGGSRRYVEAVLAALGPSAVRLGARVGRVARAADHVLVDGERFDALVIATHANEALALLADATDEEREVLGAWRYQANAAVLHTDTALMPAERGAWASWNVTAAETPTGGPRVTYQLDRLQGLAGGPYFLTLNPPEDVRGVRRELVFHHPVFSAAALAMRHRLPTLGHWQRTCYAGSYAGFGFHEDAIRAGFDAAGALGAEIPR